MQEYYKGNHLLEVSDYNRQEVLYDKKTLAELIINILLQKKGTYPNSPDLGIDIASYEFQSLTSETLYEIQTNIEEQVRQYILNNGNVKIDLELSTENEYNKAILIQFELYTEGTTPEKVSVGISKNINTKEISTKVIF